MVGDEGVHPCRQEGGDLARQVTARGRVLAAAELPGQETVLAPERPAEHLQPDPVSEPDDGARGQQPAQGVAGDDQVLAQADDLGVPADLGQPGRGDQVGIATRVAGGNEIGRRPDVVDELAQRDGGLG